VISIFSYKLELRFFMVREIKINKSGRKKLEQISSVKLFKTVRNCLLLLLYSPSFAKQLDQHPKQELFPDQ
jgi:hypothetical protein